MINENILDHNFENKEAVSVLESKLINSFL